MVFKDIIPIYLLQSNEKYIGNTVFINLTDW